MSKKPTKKSDAASAQPENRSVFDFLYHDARRVASFLAQLDQDGYLQSLKKSGQTTQSTSEKNTIQGSGGIPAVASVQGTSEALVGDQIVQSADRIYDPLWANALALLDHLEQRSLLSRSVGEASIGQFVLATGNLKFLNLNLLPALWQSDAARQLFTGSLNSIDPAQIINNQVGFDLVRSLPHALQAQIWVPDPFSASWMFLDESNLVTPASTVLLNYGTNLPGEWSVLGIKDALPDGGPELDQTLAQAMNSDLMQTALERHTTPLAMLSDMLSPLARLMMGRNGSFYGITPILIFREVKAVEVD